MNRWLVGLVASLLLACAQEEEEAPHLVTSWDAQAGERLSPAEELECEITAFTMTTWPREPVSGTAVEGSAWEHYRPALDETQKVVATWSENLADRVKALALDVSIDPERVPEDVKTALASLAPAFAGIERGANTKETSGYPEIRAGIDGEDELPSAAIKVSDPLILSAILLAAEGKGDRAVDRLLALHRFGRDFARGSPYMQALVGQTLAASGMEAVGRLVAGDRVGPAERERILQVARNGVRSDFLSGPCMEAERLSLLSTYRRVAEGVITFAELTGNEDASSDGSKDAAVARLTWQELGRVLSGLASKPDAIREARRRLWAFQKERPESPAAPAMYFFERAWPDETAGGDRLVTATEAVLFGVAILRYREEHGKLPTLLASVRPREIRPRPDGSAWKLSAIPGKGSLGLHTERTKPEDAYFVLPRAE